MALPKYVVTDVQEAMAAVDLAMEILLASDIEARNDALVQLQSAKNRLWWAVPVPVEGRDLRMENR